jgi:hypothetical protein
MEKLCNILSEIHLRLSHYPLQPRAVCKSARRRKLSQFDPNVLLVLVASPDISCMQVSALSCIAGCRVASFRCSACRIPQNSARRRIDDETSKRSQASRWRMIYASTTGKTRSERKVVTRKISQTSRRTRCDVDTMKL